MRVAEAVAAAVGRRRALCSRGLAPELRRELRELGIEVVELPLRGCSAVPAPVEGDEVVVGGRPNLLGGFDPVPAGGIAVLHGELSGPGEPAPGLVEIPVAGAERWNDAATAVAAARGLAKALRQLRGVRIVCDPVTPVVVALLPRHPRGLEQLPFPTIVLGAYPELPGGIRIAVPDGASRPTCATYADALRSILERGVSP